MRNQLNFMLLTLSLTAGNSIFSIASTEDVRNALDPSKNGFNAAMDPSRNGVARAFDPSRNGFNSAANDVGNYFTEGSRSQQATRGLAVGAAGAAVVAGSVAAGYGVNKYLKRRKKRMSTTTPAPTPTTATAPARATRHWWNRNKSSEEPVMTPVVPQVAPPTNSTAAAPTQATTPTQTTAQRQSTNRSFGNRRR